VRAYKHTVGLIHCKAKDTEIENDQENDERLQRVDIVNVLIMGTF
jgi:hypothetical protein